MISQEKKPSSPLILLLLLLLVLSVTTANGYKSETKSKKCEPITIPLCQGIGYNMTSYPNSYGHEKQDEAGLEVHQFYPLVEVNCYKHLKFFLCAMYTPICQDNYDLTVMPCREVCLEARKHCAPLMQQYGFKWPLTLQCDPLPKMADQQSSGQLCAAPPDTPDNSNPTVTQSNEVAVRHPVTKQYPVAPPELLGIDVLDRQCQCKCVRPFFVTNRPENAIHNVSHCAYACESEAIQASEDRQFLNAWISVWSGICLALSLFTVLTFLTDMARFPYPERPIFFLSLCQMMVSMGFLLRVVYGHKAIGCEQPVDLMIHASHHSNPSIVMPSLATQPYANTLCLLVFVLIYFFGMAASAWWVVLSLSWVLAAVPHWSTEWIAKYSTYFHLFAWLVPGFQTILVVMFQAVDGDSVTGICYVGNTDVNNLRTFVLGPLLIYFLVGVCFLSIGFLNLWGIRSNLKKTHPGVDKTSKLTQLMSKIGIYSVLYTLPAIFVILVLFYEQHYRPIWEQARLCPCAQQVESNSKTMLLLSLVKTASMLVIGWTSGVWIISAKTLQSWRRAFCCCFCCCMDDEAVNRRQGYYPAMAQEDMMHHHHPSIQQHHQHPTSSIQYNDMNNRQYHHQLIGQYGAEVLYTSQRQPDSMASPMTYANSNGTLRHCQAMHSAAIMPENV